MWAHELEHADHRGACEVDVLHAVVTALRAAAAAAFAIVDAPRKSAMRDRSSSPRWRSPPWRPATTFRGTRTEKASDGVRGAGHHGGAARGAREHARDDCRPRRRAQRAVEAAGGRRPLRAGQLAAAARQAVRLAQARRKTDGARGVGRDDPGAARVEALRRRRLGGAAAPGQATLTPEACEADGSGAPLLDDTEEPACRKGWGGGCADDHRACRRGRAARRRAARRRGGAILDRPTPWERDCDCCFRECPRSVCLLQSDGLLLACRGESVGEKLAIQWAGGRCTPPARSPPSSFFSGAACPPRGACGPSPPTTATTTTMTTTTTTTAAATTVRLATTTTVTAASGAGGLTRRLPER